MTQFRPGRFEILPMVIKNLLIINVLVFLAQSTLPRDAFNIEDTFALHTLQSHLFRPWQFITYMFLHGGFTHLLFNMLALWMFGATLESLWGPGRFLVFYIACGLGAALCHMGVLYFENETMLAQFHAIGSDEGALQAFIVKYGEDARVSFSYDGAILLKEAVLNVGTLGASGAVFGCLAAFGYLFPNDYIYWQFFIPIKVKWFVLIYAGSELINAIQNSAGDNVAHVAHLGGALVGFLMVYYWKKSNHRSIY